MPGTTSPARDPETRAQMIAELVSGVGTNELSRRFAVSKHTVRALRLEAGLIEPEMPRMEPVELSTEDAAYFSEVLGRYLTGALLNMEHLTDHLAEILTADETSERMGMRSVAELSLQVHGALRDTVMQLAALVRLPAAEEVVTAEDQATP